MQTLLWWALFVEKLAAAAGSREYEVAIVTVIVKQFQIAKATLDFKLSGI